MTACLQGTRLGKGRLGLIPPPCMNVNHHMQIAVTSSDFNLSQEMFPGKLKLQKKNHLLVELAK